MKAWQFTGTGNPLELNDVPEPTPGPGEVVVDVKAAGVCHSDVSASTTRDGWRCSPSCPTRWGTRPQG